MLLYKGMPTLAAKVVFSLPGILDMLLMRFLGWLQRSDLVCLPFKVDVDLSYEGKGSPLVAGRWSWTWPFIRLLRIEWYFEPIDNNSRAVSHNYS